MSFWGLYLCVYTQNTRTSQGKIFRHSIPNHDGSKPVMMMKNEGLCFCTLKRFDGIFLRIFFKIVSAAWTVKLVFKGLIRVVSDTPTPAPFYGTKGSFFAFGPPKEKKSPNVIETWMSRWYVQVIFCKIEALFFSITPKWDVWWSEICTICANQEKISWSLSK